LTRNPYALSRNTCGSSSGSGAAIAASLAVMAVGTETDGSITCPSAVNGLVGFKPTVGLLSQQYIIPISHSQDTAGPMARSVHDAAVLLNAMSTRPGSPDYVRDLTSTSLQGLRLGVMRPLSGYHPGTDAVFQQTLASLEKAGAVLVEIRTMDSLSDIGKNEFAVLLSELIHGLDAYLADTSKAVKTRSLAELIAFNREHAAAEMPYFGQDLFETAQRSSGLQSADYQRALANSGKAARTRLDGLLAQYAVAALVAPSGSPAWTTDLLNGDHYLGSASTLPAVAGYPHLTVPMGVVHGMPVGISIITGQWQDSKALQIGHAIEQATKARQTPRYLQSIP
jgi:amidase